MSSLRGRWLFLLLAVAAEACAGRVRPTSSPAPPNSSTPVRYVATAYCTGTLTASGASVGRGIVAADPRILPLGTVIRIVEAPKPYVGTYRVLDTGPGIQGRRLDLYEPDCRKARRFGRRTIEVVVLTGSR
jgi:3D (Asp-Asp-Asp) domain-containing protein